MKKARRWLLITASLLMLVTNTAAVAPFKKVSIATTSATTTTSTTTEAPSSEAPSENSSATTKNSKLTGIPQIDYIWDPNLPRELRGYNLSSYPFFSTVPPEEDIHFKCDGLHDGFYASIEHKCQVYHHCVYGIRHDFLCANFTAFDQRTFICHFVSDVDCEGSKNYWNRNDDLYMATTTTTTTTTTTEPPPTPRRRIVRPLRPLRRPMNRRPIDDYYYEDEEEPLAVYEDDYYEERLNRRRKPRPRQRKPVVEYEEDYSEDKPRRQNSRDRFRDEEELEDDDDSDRRKYDRHNARNKPADRRKSGGRKTSAGRLGGDERRSFHDDRMQPNRKDKARISPSTDSVDPVDPPPRRLTGRRRINEKRIPSSGIDDIDDYEKPQGHAPDQEEAAEEEAPPKVKTTPKPLEEFITPKAGSGSVYARPRAPPRIARPVPLNEKKKFQYPVQKTGTTPSPEATHAAEEDYYEDESYDDVRAQRVHPRRRVAESKFDEDDVPSSKRRNQNDTPSIKKNVSQTTIRRPTTEKKHLTIAEEDDYDSIGGASNEPVDSHTSSRRRPFTTRNRSSFGPPVGRGADDVDFVDDDYEERPLRPVHRLRPKAAARKGSKKPRRPIEEEDFYEQEPERQTRNRANSNRPKTGGGARLRQSSTTTTSTTLAPIEDAASESELEEEDEPPVPTSLSRGSANSGRTATVRVVKRPFLPSRGGSPYLPRGLQPVGVALKPLSTHTTDSTPIDMGSTISGVRLLEHGAPILRDSGSGSAIASVHSHLHDSNGDERESKSEVKLAQIHRTTLPPRSALPESQPRPEPQPKITLDELYENDYDVTLNDALNPTLKPLAPHYNNHPNHNSAFQNAYASEPGVSTFVNNNKSPTLYHNNNNQYQQQQHQHNHQQNSYQTKPQASLSQSQTHLEPHQASISLQSQIHQQPEHLLSQQQTRQQQQQQQPQQQQSAYNDYNSDDSYFSPTDIRRRAVVAAPQPYSSRTDYRGVSMRIAQHFYDDLEY